MLESTRTNGAQIDRPTVASFSAKVASATLTLAGIAYRLLDRRIDGADTWLLWPQVEHLKTVVELLEDALLEAEHRGEYRPDGWPPLRLASIQPLPPGARRNAA